MNIAAVLNLYKSTPLITEEPIRAMFSGFNKLIEQIPDSKMSEIIDSNADEFLLSVINPEQIGIFSYLSGMKHITSVKVTGAEELFHICHHGIISEMYLYLHDEHFVLVLDETFDEENQKVSDLNKLFKGKAYLSGNTLFVPFSVLM